MAGICVQESASVITATGETAAQCIASGHYWLQAAVDVAGRTYIADLPTDQLQTVLVAVIGCLGAAYGFRVVLSLLR